MKKLMIVTVIIACLSLCVAVWPRTEVTEETTPVPPQVTVVSDPKPIVENIAAGAETTPPTEEEKIEIPQDEPLREPIPEPEPVPEEIPETTEVQTTPAQVSAPTPAPSQAVTNPKSVDMVYVPGFGWLECQGSGEVIHDESICENGNKIGIMG